VFENKDVKDFTLSPHVHLCLERHAVKEQLLRAFLVEADPEASGVSRNNVGSIVTKLDVDIFEAHLHPEGLIRPKLLLEEVHVAVDGGCVERIPFQFKHLVESLRVEVEVEQG